MFTNPQNRKDYPAFVLFPQCPPSNFWPFESQPASYDATTFPIDYPTSTPIKLVKELIDSYLQMEEIDKDRIYILGISMGGMGTFDIACRYPETFAAAIPICGGVNVERLDNKVKKHILATFPRRRRRSRSRKQFPPSLPETYKYQS